MQRRVLCTGKGGKRRTPTKGVYVENCCLQRRGRVLAAAGAVSGVNGNTVQCINTAACVVAVAALNKTR